MPNSEDEEEIRRKSLEYQSVEDPNMKEEAGLEEGSYLPGGAEDYLPSPINAIKKMRAAGKATTKIVDEVVDISKLDKTGNEIFYRVPKEVLQQLKEKYGELTHKILKPYHVDTKSSFGAGRPNTAHKKTWATTGKK
jgi:hypothetical protein